MQRSFSILVAFVLLLAEAVSAQPSILSTKQLNTYTTYFNAIDTEKVVNLIPNDKAFGWLSKNIPLFDCPDTLINSIYYYRWWAFRKHLKQTPDGFVFTEFITPVNHAGKYNTVSSALGHHIYEGRWLLDTSYLNQYISFWLNIDKKTPKPHLRAFSSWLQDAIYNRYLVTTDREFIRTNLATLDSDYHQWEAEKRLPDGMFWQFDVRDAMEESISGSRKEKNIRPTINSYMFGNAEAMYKMATIIGNDTLAQSYKTRAEQIRSAVQNTLWDDQASFFKVKMAKGGFSDAREAIGFIPWYFNLPKDENKYARQWDQLIDSGGFDAPWGITTAERRHPLFRTHGTGHGCEWDGAVWPFATTQTLKALSNLLTNYRYHGKMNAGVFYDELHKYARSHQKNGKPYLGEYQDEKNGYWLKGDDPRSSYYNHSGFADLIITDLVGLKPRADDFIEINPLVPPGKWNWFCLDKVAYHGKLLTILWDKTGKKYGKGKGFLVFADGKLIHREADLRRINFKMI